MNKYRVVLAAALASLFLIGAAGAQSHRLLLSVKEVVAVPSLTNAPVSLPALCDADGNVYLQPYYQGAGVLLLRISPDGKSTQFSLDSAPGFAAGYSGFGVTPNGEVYELAGSEGSAYIVGFSEDGQVQSKIKLEEKLWPMHVTPLLGGRNFLVTGGEKQEDGTIASFTGIFDAAGRLLKRLSLPGDPVSLGKPDATRPTEVPAAMMAMQMGFVMSDGNGNIYILRRSSPATLYKLNSGGELLRTSKLRPPAKNMVINGMSSAAGQVALLFEENSDKENPARVIRVIDSLTGKITAAYDVPPADGGAFACYALNRFGFISSDDQHHLAIAWAAP